MLRHLSIRHFALIDELEVSFGEGLNIITGETGSGKSIILGALGLLLGDRADSKSIQHGKSKCVLEATFSDSTAVLESIFEEEDLDYTSEIILRREVKDQGKSRAFVNDTPVTLQVLRSIGLHLVDIHSQHQTLQINDPAFQMGVLDSYSENDEVLERYRKLHSEYSGLKADLNELRSRHAKAQNERDFLQFQLQELEAAALDSIDMEELESEYQTLSHASEITTNLLAIYALLVGNEDASRIAVARAAELMDDLGDYGKAYAELGSRLRSALIELDDLGADAEALAGKIEADPKRLQALEQQRNTLFKLQQKHHLQHPAELLTKRDELRAQVAGLDEDETELERLSTQLKHLYEQVLKQGEQLGKLRRGSAAAFEREVTQMLRALSMPNAQFKLHFEPLDAPAPWGMEKVHMHFSANAGIPPQPLKQVASGGELSRLMLAIKNLAGKHKRGRSIVFDEIDTGVSGEVADTMGRILREMSAQAQLLCITHLPQIASKGTAHYKVFKHTNKGQTLTGMQRLDEASRVMEIAQMLSGATTTTAALEQARELLR